jgi:hypothetical protein
VRTLAARSFAEASGDGAAAGIAVAEGVFATSAYLTTGGVSNV